MNQIITIADATDQFRSAKLGTSSNSYQLTGGGTNSSYWIQSGTDLYYNTGTCRYK